ncbi:DUF4910 domain-containing protein [Pseudodesulfovibrio portus]|uniref:Peptidase M28 n=1 Tax=Pseudodesulfovibrio portus TaxID=231439 RepID=A0ABM8ANN8_9BACT|nr:DUF4910 domain-containing protein [Pseudodesulfovibrio portus]BDQ33004.1 peptidase M28 [Pseudodesulfovibrio portus]
MMKNIIDSIWALPRDLVSDGYDQAIDALSDMLPMRIHEYPTGTECFTWIVPEKWTCRDARLETMDGKTLFSYKDNPLHAVSYSLPYSGEVDRETLFQHLHTRPDMPEAIPFIFKYYKRDWGLCCRHSLKQTLTDDTYRVVIDTEFTQGALKVGEVVVKGKKQDCYIFCAHLCHPAQTNDDMAGVAVGMDVFRRLLEGPQPEYTYRLVILPETIGSAAWLSHNESLIPHIKGGLFLEMLGTPHPHALQRSNTPDSQMDTICRLITREADPKMWEDDFMKVILNDERMFNGPGINVPMLSLSRVLQRDDLYDPPYSEYHTSLDTPDVLDWDNLNRSSRLVSRIIEAIEANRIPVPLFKGELFCSRFKSIDYASMFHVMNAVIYRLDGEKSIADIARESGLPYDDVVAFIEILKKEKLVRLA